MDVFEAIRTVLAVRAYADRPVPHEVVQKVIEAARLTGSSKNDQPWHFIAVERAETLKALSEVATSGRYVGEAAFAVAVAVRSDSIYGVSDGSRAVQSMVLAAWEEGAGTGVVTHNGKMIENLHVDIARRVLSTHEAILARS